METLFEVVKYISYVTAPVFTFIFCLKFAGAVTYENSIQKTIDKMVGKKRIYGLMKPFWIALISWALLFAI